MSEYVKGREIMVTWPFNNKDLQRKVGIGLAIIGFLMMAYSGTPESISVLPFDIQFLGICIFMLGAFYFLTLE